MSKQDVTLDEQPVAEPVAPDEPTVAELLQDIPDAGEGDLASDTPEAEAQPDRPRDRDDLVLVRSLIPVSADGGRRVALLENDPRHPGGTAHVVDEHPVWAYPTYALRQKVVAGEIEVLDGRDLLAEHREAVAQGEAHLVAQRQAAVRRERIAALREQARVAEGNARWHEIQAAPLQPFEVSKTHADEARTHAAELRAEAERLERGEEA